MRIRYVYHNQETIFDCELATVVVGRPKRDISVELDLTPDQGVSRPHARFQLLENQWWIEDLDSRVGTKLDGREIKGGGRQPLRIGSNIQIGETTLWVENLEIPSFVSIQTRQPPSDELPDVAITEVLGVKESMVLGCATSVEDRAFERLALLYELPLELGAEGPLNPLLQGTLERLVVAIPAAQRGAILVQDAATGRLLLKAHLPPGNPSVSMTTANHAMMRCEGFIWNRTLDPSSSQRENRIASGIYAPLVCNAKSLGVICVDNFDGSRAFDSQDLQLLVAAARQIAMAVSHRALQEELRRSAALVERLLTNFSPKICSKLLDKASQGRLRLGGEKSEVTLLVSDIRGFTRLSAEMDAEDLMDMLNAYFSPLVEAIFRFDGTIDKFIGDAILAVFGSPEPDAEQHLKAVRAALAMQSVMDEVSKSRRARGQVTCEIGIGVHCGEVLHGFIGSDERMEFTVIGDAVNCASRYCDGAAAGEILISPDMHQRVWQTVQASAAKVSTKHEGNWPAFRVLGCKGS